ncbi:nuclease-related domain-containing protein [Neobacillus drentensis]|uniref:nuclease-related domain-containing protein n=1 Tax=Neobacillus drentensis TaxID=220684 RepID=UPI002FFFE32B
MPYKARIESDEIKIWRILNSRMHLTVDEQKNFLYLEKGFAGEVQFDLYTEKLQSKPLILNDLLLESNKSNLQIDSTLMYPKTIYLFEVKNFEGDHIYENGNFYTLSEKGKRREIKNPLDQLKRIKYLFRQLLQNLGYHYNVEGYVVFINPAFTLYQSPKDEPIIYLSQLPRFMKKLNELPCQLTKQDKALADKLVALHQTESPYTRIRPYKYEELKKGPTCQTCHSSSVSVCGKKLVCDVCGCEEMVESAVLRGVGELQLLFPDMKITTNLVYDWCEGTGSKKRISRVLGKHFNITGVHQWTYYE